MGPGGLRDWLAGPCNEGDQVHGMATAILAAGLRGLCDAGGDGAGGVSGGAETVVVLIPIDGARAYVRARAVVYEGVKPWTPTRQDAREQALLREALESGRYDGLSDEAWCALLETLEH